MAKQQSLSQSEVVNVLHLIYIILSSLQETSIREMDLVVNITNINGYRAVATYKTINYLIDKKMIEKSPTLLLSITELGLKKMENFDKHCKEIHDEVCN